MSKIKNGGLDQYCAEPFKQQQFGTAGVEGVKLASLQYYIDHSLSLLSSLANFSRQTVKPIVAMFHSVFHYRLKTFLLFKLVRSLAIYPLLAPISWHSTTRCLAVTSL